MSNLKKWFLGVTLLTLGGLLLHWDWYQSIPTHHHNKTFTILYWTPMFKQLDFNLGLGSAIFKECSFKNCFTTYNRTLLPIERFDAVLFHAVDFPEGEPRPPNRSTNQLYILSNQESPIHTPHFQGHTAGFYNWTMTYLYDSDIVRPYGFFEPKPTDYRLPLQRVNDKTKMAAWMVSNCYTTSQREVVAKKLAKYVEVDVYGQCGSYTCSKDTPEACYEMIEATYKFYLSFENSLCEDYVTEKLFNVLKLDIVPVVYGGANYSKVAPPHSVINVNDFDGLEELATYLKFLDENPEEYLKYFEWKKNFVVSTSNRLTLCSLCQKLNAVERSSKSYSDLDRWWWGDDDLSRCLISDEIED